MPLLECGDVPSLKAVRLRRMLTQVELAAKSGVSQGTIARIETGERKRVALRTVKALGAALEVDPGRGRRVPAGAGARPIEARA